MTETTELKPGRVSASDKLATTDKVARSIIAEEASLKQKKTERLRRLREEREAEAEEKPAAKKASGKKK
ncbi:hypothetical protein [Martelella limonii]|uniref:hypothetical protein n=1 Tax=Martelella limonii TaxID=1647649 RepID=UPI001580B38C|nr:hypothetical protein [Martelella limonii]